MKFLKKISPKSTLKSMRLLILDRYIIGKFLRTYFFAIAMIVVIVVIFDAAEKIDDFLEAHVPWSSIISGYYINFIPYFVNQFSGLFTFIAVIFFTSKMAYDTEIIAILSSGVSFNRLMYPYFVAAAFITGLSLLLNLLVIPAANERRLAFERKYMADNQNTTLAYDQFTYRQVAPDTFVFIKDYNDVDTKAAFLVLETYDGGRVVSSLEAQEVDFDDNTRRWTAPRYLHRIYDTISERDTLIKSERPLDTLINISSEELGRVEDLIQTMNSSQLSRFIDVQNEKGSDLVSLFQVEAQNRYAYPFSTFILTLIGVALSSRKVRGGTGLHIGIGITLCFSYIVLMRFASEFAKSGSLPAWIAIWMPNFIYLLIGLYLYRKAPK